MSLIRLWLLAALAALTLAVLPGCGGDSKYYVPVDSQLKPFNKPEADDLVSSGDSDDDYETADDPGDTGGATPAVDTSGTPAPTPASAPAATPGSAPAPAPAAAPAGKGKSAKAPKASKAAAH